MCVLSHIQLFVTPGIVASQAPLSTGFSRQEYWSGLPSAFPGNLPNPGMEPESPALKQFLLPLNTKEATYRCPIIPGTFVEKIGLLDWIASAYF